MAGGRLVLTVPRKRNAYGTGRRYRRTRYTRGLATLPKMMSASARRRRLLGTDTKVFYFKINGVIRTKGDSQNQWGAFRTQFLGETPASSASWTAAGVLYDNYKILCMKITLHPADIDDTPTPAGLPIKRGNHCTWTDLSYDAPAVEPAVISDVINYGSTRVVNPLKRHSRTVYRPKGIPGWGSCTTNTADPWKGSVELLINGATQGGVGPGVGYPIYYYVMEYKVLFRTRTEN